MNPITVENVKKAFKGTLKSLPGTIKTELGTLTFTQNIIEKKVAEDDKNKKSREHFLVEILPFTSFIISVPTCLCRPCKV